jgi:ferredoxin-NADP reductase
MQLKLIKKIEVAKDTMSFFFKPETSLTWLAGQYIHITLSKLDYPDERGATRHMTIASSPTEGGLLQITTRIREKSGYKKTLNELPVGSVVEGNGLHGLFVFDKNSKNNVFLAGGIGITPFRSMIKWNIDKKLNIPVYLIYSNSDSEFVFKDELDNWQKENDFLKIQYVNTSEMGHVDSKMIKKSVDDWGLKPNDCTFWIVGPNTFVNAMEEILDRLNISENNIKSEKFTGY